MAEKWTVRCDEGGQLITTEEENAICAAERPLMRLASSHLARRTATQIRQSFEV